MKLFTLLAISLMSTAAIAQDFANTHQHLIFDHATPKPEIGKVNVKSRINNQVPGHSSNFIQLEPYGTPKLSFDVPQKQFEKEKAWANSVFVATTGTGTSQGTAFLVGQNLVLTNKHVLANDKECRKFGIDLNHVREFVPCKEVLHCSKTHDFCLIKLDTMKNGKEVGEEVKPLKFSEKVPTKNDMALVIGNAQGMGLHAASYAGIRDMDADWGHFNRAFSGNSGSPLLNTNGEILGIHYARGGDAGEVGGPKDRMIGFAVKSSTMLKEIKNIIVKEALDDLKVSYRCE